MTARNDRSKREGILFSHVIECPVCGERAHSFRIRRVRDLRTVDGEFYHRTATCAGSMTRDTPVAMEVLRLAVESDLSNGGNGKCTILRTPPMLLMLCPTV
jgi:hypothetical protein